MASVIYDRFFANLMNKEIDLEGDTVKVALLTSSHTPDQTGQNVWTDVSATEVTATDGYTAGGAEITGKSVTPGQTTYWDGGDVQWTNSTVTARYGIIYDDTLTDDDLIAAIDFTEDKSTSSGTFKIEWNANGIITLASA